MKSALMKPTAGFAPASPAYETGSLLLTYAGGRARQVPPLPITALQAAAFSGSPRAQGVSRSFLPTIYGDGRCCPGNASDEAARLANECGHLAIRVVPNCFAPNGRSRIRTDGAVAGSPVFQTGTRCQSGTILPGI